MTAAFQCTNRLAWHKWIHWEQMAGSNTQYKTHATMQGDEHSIAAATAFA